MNTRFEIGKVSGSRPFCTSASFNSGMLCAQPALVDPPEPIQPSASRAVRRTASGWPTPIQIGGRGIRNRLGGIRLSRGSLKGACVLTLGLAADALVTSAYLLERRPR